MKKVRLPKKVVPIGNKAYSAEDVLEEVVLTRPFWRRIGNVKVALSISDKLACPGDKIFTDMEHDMLVKDASMQDAGGIAPPSMNRFYLEVLAALYDAEEVVEDREARHAAE
jgi:hypothetical protein